MRRGWRAGSNVIRLTPWRRRRYRWWLGAGLVLLPATMWLAVQGPGTGGGGPSSPDLSWTTILGSTDNLRAAVSDGTSVWWVREGDVLAGDWRVTRIAARPPGVTLSHDEAGHHALPYAGGEPNRKPGEAPTTGARAGVYRSPEPPGSSTATPLKIRGTPVRLHGIDAPESAQRCRADGRLWPCGQDATQALAGYIGLQDCRVRGARPGPLRPGCGGVPGWRRRRQCLDGGSRMGAGLPPAFDGLRRRGACGAGREAGRVAGRRRRALGLEPRRAPGGRVIIMTGVEEGKAMTKDDTPPAKPDRRFRNTWRCPAGLWKRWVAALPEGSEPLVTMTLRVKGLVRNAERQAGQDMRMTSWVLPAELVDRIAEAAEAQQMSPAEWAEGVLTRGRRPGVRQGT